MDNHIEAFTPLVWGIKASLASYVRGLEDGEIAVQSPAELTLTGQSCGQESAEGFSFAPDPNGSWFDASTQTGHLRFRGAVTFSGHFNTMRMELRDPRLDLRDGAGALSVRTNGPIGTPRWEAIATASRLPSTNLSCGFSLDLALTAAGRMLLGQQYQVGQALDPAFVEKVQSFQSETH